MTIIKDTIAVAAAAEPRVNQVGSAVLRYGLALVIGWIGVLKFFSYEAQGIQPLVANSPVMGWLYEIFSVTAFSALLGVVEVATAVLIAAKPWWPKVSAVGSVAAIGIFVTTISFLLTTPGVGEAAAGGFPMLSVTGQFLIKDVVLLGAAVWTLADSMRAARVAGLALDPR